MNKLKLPTLFLGLIFSTFIYGQYSDFDLSKYKLPDIKTNRLDLNFDLNNNGANIRTQSTYDTSESRNNNFRGTINLDYYNFRNTEKYQGDLNINTYFTPQFSNNLTNELESRSKSLQSTIYIRSSNKFFNQDLNFIEVDPSISFNTYNQSSYQDITSTQSSDNNYANFNSSISIPVSVGHGRIEPVQDLRLAIYIIEELNKLGKISELPSEEVLIDLAKEISKIKKKRFFDSRIRRIEELQLIDSFLIANNLISSNDIDYFSVLNDQWSYAYGPQRLSGFSYSIGIDNSVAFSKSYSKIINGNDDPIRNKTGFNEYKIGGIVEVSYAKPINLYWQTSASLITSYNLLFTQDPFYNGNQLATYRSKVLYTDLNYSIQYLPNSRTSFEFHIDAGYQNIYEYRASVDTVTVDYDDRYSQFSIYPGLNIYYYISPQLRVQLNSSISLLKSIDRSSNVDPVSIIPDYELLNRNFRNSFSLTFIYSFF